MKPSKLETIYISSIDDSVGVNLAVLSVQLAEASRIADEAHKAHVDGQNNRAVGTLVPLEQILADCCCLLRAGLVLHGLRNCTPAGSTKLSRRSR